MKDIISKKMNDNDSHSKKKIISKVKVSLILGHTASHRDVITSDEKTHDWSFYVRGEAGTKIESYVEKVIFTLHESFNNPVQVITEPPYEIYEQGYGTFLMQVEVRFRNKREPKKINYKYDLLLPGKGVPPIKRSRKEILTFTNTNSDFMSKLLEGGGALYHFDTQGMILSGPNLKAPTTESSSSQNNKNLKVEAPSKTVHKQTVKKKVKHKSEEAKIRKEKDKTKEEKKKESEINKDVPKADSHKKNKIGKSSSSNRPQSATPNEFSQGDTAKADKQISSVLASIGDLESTDEEDYFKEGSSKPLKSEVRESPVKKAPSKPKPKEKPSKVKKEAQSFIEFEKIDILKPTKVKLKKLPKEDDSNKHEETKEFAKKKKDNRVLEEPKILNASEKKKKDNRVLEEAKILNASEKKKKEHATKENIKRTMKRTSSLSVDSDVDQDEKPISITKEKHKLKHRATELTKESNIQNRERSSSLSVDSDLDSEQAIPVIKHRKKHSKESSKESKKYSRKRSSSLSVDSDIDCEKRFKVLPVEKNKKHHIIEPTKENKKHSRKRSDSLSDDTEDDGVKTPSSDVDPYEVAQWLQLDDDYKDSKHRKDDHHSEQSSGDKRQKEKKNKHKQAKTDPDVQKVNKPIFHHQSPIEQYDKLEIPKKEIRQYSSSPDTASVSDRKNKLIVQEVLSPKKEQHLYESPSSTNSVNNQPSLNIKDEGEYELHETGSEVTSHLKTEPVQHEEQPALTLAPEHVRYMLNVYNKLYQLQRSDDRQTISEIVNVFTEHNQNFSISDSGVSFDLVNCDLETLQTIDNVLSSC